MTTRRISDLAATHVTVSARDENTGEEVSIQLPIVRDYRNGEAGVVILELVGAHRADGTRGLAGRPALGAPPYGRGEERACGFYSRTEYIPTDLNSFTSSYGVIRCASKRAGHKEREDAYPLLHQ